MGCKAVERSLQEPELFRLLFGRCDGRRRWWRRRRRGEGCEVSLYAVEVALEVGHQRAVVQRRGRMVQRHVGHVTALDESSMDPRDRAQSRHQELQRMAAEV